MVRTTTSGERPPQPVLGSFHSLLPLVEISFVSVPAGRGQDHLELRKHPAPPTAPPAPHGARRSRFHPRRSPHTHPELGALRPAPHGLRHGDHGPYRPQRTGSLPTAIPLTSSRWPRLPHTAPHLTAAHRPPSKKPHPLTCSAPSPTWALPPAGLPIPLSSPPTQGWAPLGDQPDTCFPDKRPPCRSPTLTPRGCPETREVVLGVQETPVPSLQPEEGQVLTRGPREPSPCPGPAAQPLGRRPPGGAEGRQAGEGPGGPGQGEVGSMLSLGSQSWLLQA